jgi:altronate dehydratase small subunit
MALSAFVLNSQDNVATAVRKLDSGEAIGVEMEENVVNIVLLQAVPFGHKFALKDIESGEPIIKYGEKIGQATARINKGEHVHIHNVQGFRGRGDKR